MSPQLIPRKFGEYSEICQGIIHLNKNIYTPFIWTIIQEIFIFVIHFYAKIVSCNFVFIRPDAPATRRPRRAPDVTVAPSL